MLRLIAFPLAYLIFMVPLPAIVFYQLALPLQLVASRLGAEGLNALGVHTMREGNLLILPNCTLGVIESCSGIRSLLALFAAVTAYGHLTGSVLWRRCAVLLFALPVVIACNGLRLIADGLLSSIGGPQADSGLIHFALGIVSFSLACGALLLADESLGILTLKLAPRVPN